MCSEKKDTNIPAQFQHRTKVVSIKSTVANPVPAAAFFENQYVVSSVRCYCFLLLLFSLSRLDILAAYCQITWTISAWRWRVSFRPWRGSQRINLGWRSVYHWRSHQGRRGDLDPQWCTEQHHIYMYIYIYISAYTHGYVHASIHVMFCCTCVLSDTRHLPFWCNYGG